jgi:hypothetical protein
VGGGMFGYMRAMRGAQALAFKGPGMPEEEDGTADRYSACDEQNYCMIYDHLGKILEHSQV